MNNATHQFNNDDFNFDRPIHLVNTTPDPAQLQHSKANRKKALVAVSLVLTLAVGCIALIIGSSAAEAANMPTFTVANALSAKQDSSIAGVATVSIAVIAIGAVAIFSRKK